MSINPMSTPGIAYSRQQGMTNLLNGLFNYTASLDSNGDGKLDTNELRQVPVLGTQLNQPEMDGFSRSISALDGQAGVSPYDLSIALLHAETVNGGQLDGIITAQDLQGEVQSVRNNLAQNRPLHPMEKVESFHTIPGLDLTPGEQILQNVYERTASVISPNPFSAYQSWALQPEESFNTQFTNWTNDVASINPELQQQYVKNSYQNLVSSFPPGSPEAQTQEMLRQQVGNLQFSPEELAALQQAGVSEAQIAQLNNTLAPLITPPSQNSGPGAQQALLQAGVSPETLSTLDPNKATELAGNLKRIQNDITHGVSTRESVNIGFLALDSDTSGALTQAMINPNYVQNLNGEQMKAWAKIIANAGTRTSSEQDSFGTENGVKQFVQSNIDSPNPQMAKAAFSVANEMMRFWEIVPTLQQSSYDTDAGYGREAQEVKQLLSDIQFTNLYQQRLDRLNQ